MASFDIEIVGKIGSMALIRKEDNDIDYNIFSRLCNELRPGIIWVTSGATEIGRLDYIKRTGRQLEGDMDDVKTDYAAQGQAILMQTYRQFISPRYGVRQILVEHQHFNDPEKRNHLKEMFLRAVRQETIPIVNYNDPVSVEENRKMELASLREQGNDVVECVDNDETAAVITTLVKARRLVLLTTVDGIYADPFDPSTLVREIGGKNIPEVIENILEMEKYCLGASREGANGARAKLHYAIEPVKQGTEVIIANAKYRLRDILAGTVNRTVVGVR
ncbi:MAG: amino acid kinase family protein [Christensenellales bacterium]